MIWTNPSKPVTRLKLETFTHEGTTEEKKQEYQLPPDKPDRATVVQLSGGRRKNVLPYVDPVAAVLAAAKAQLGPKPPAQPTAAGCGQAQSSRPQTLGGRLNKSASVQHTTRSPDP